MGVGAGASSRSAAGAVVPDFAEQVGDILAMLDGVDAHAVPGERAGLTRGVFGSS